MKPVAAGEVDGLSFYFSRISPLYPDLHFHYLYPSLSLSINIPPCHYTSSSASQRTTRHRRLVDASFASC